MLNKSNEIIFFRLTAIERKVMEDFQEKGLFENLLSNIK